MARQPKFNPTETRFGWMISIPESMSSTGKRERRFFETDKLAIAFGKKLRSEFNAGMRGGVIPFALAMDAAEASRLLEPFGITLLDAVKMAVTRLTATGSAETFQERYDRALLANEGRWSDRYENDMGKLPRWVGKPFMATRLAEIDDMAIVAALKANGAGSQSTLDTRGRYVSAIIGHRDRHHKSTEIRILSMAQCEALVTACQSPEERRAVGLLLWAGIRPDAEDGEISRLQWENVRKTEIYVPSDTSKTGTDRHIPITPRLRRMISGHNPDGPVVPANWKRVYQRLRKDGGVTGQDVLRHTFASHFLAAFGDMATKQAMGHTAGSDTLFRHYRRAVTEADGKRFFE